MTGPLGDDCDHAELSAVTPENLLREARRQKGLPSGDVPAACVLDPDGDIVRWRPPCMRSRGRGGVPSSALPT